MSSEVILRVDIVTLLPPFVVYKYGFEIFRKKIGVGGQVQLEMPSERKTEKREKEKKSNEIESNRTLTDS